MCVPIQNADASSSPSILQYAPKDNPGDILSYAPADIDRLRQAYANGATGDVSQLPFGVIRKLRDGQPQQVQDQLGPADHRAYARDAASNGPLMAAQEALMIPAYTIGKAVGGTHARSHASWDEVSQAYAGVLEGLAQWRNNTPPSH